MREELIEITYSPPCLYKKDDWIWFNKKGFVGGGYVVKTFKDRVMITRGGLNEIVMTKYITQRDQRGRTN